MKPMYIPLVPSCENELISKDDKDNMISSRLLALFFIEKDLDKMVKNYLPNI